MRQPVEKTGKRRMTFQESPTGESKAEGEARIAPGSPFGKPKFRAVR